METYYIQHVFTNYKVTYKKLTTINLNALRGIV